MNDLLRLLNRQPWNITRDALDALQHLALRMDIPGAPVPTAEQLAALHARAGRPLTAKGGAVAVIPIYGPLSQRSTGGGFFSEPMLGYDEIGAMFDQALADPQVGAVLLDVDSPGGSVFGLEELAARIFAARDVKPVVAIADSFMASAAYYLGSQARELIATPSAMVGSIGTIAEHIDYSKRIEMMGLKVTEVTAGKYKNEMSDVQPLTEEGRAQLQAVVDHYYGQFVEAVARGRGTTAAKVKSDMGQGRMFTPQEAKAANMIDRVATLPDTLARMAGARPTAGARAEDPAPAPAAGGLHPSVAAAQLALAERG